MRKLLAQLSMLLVMAFVFAGCNIIESDISIQYPVNDARYVGTVSEGPPINNGSIELMNDEWVITYEDNPGTADIVLNGHKIGQHFTFGATSATANVSDFKQFFRQGENTLSVDILNFGPGVRFFMDNAGPVLVVSRGEIVVEGANKYLELEGYLRDASIVSSTLELDLVEILGYGADGLLQRDSNPTSLEVTVDGNGRFCHADAAQTDLNIDAGVTCNSKFDITSVVDSGNEWLYSFVGQDLHGYTSEKEYLADSDGTQTLPIRNAIRAAVGDSFIESLRPIIASSIYDTLQAAPIDARCHRDDGGDYDTDDLDGDNFEDSAVSCGTWDDLNVCGDVVGVVKGKNIKQADFDKLDEADGTLDGVADGKTIDDPSYACTDTTKDGARLPLGINPVDTGILGMQAWVQRAYIHDGSDITVGGISLKDRVGTVLLNGFKVKEDNLLDLDLIITEMVVKLEIPGGLNIELGMYIQRIIVDSDAEVSAVDKNVNIQLTNSDFVLEGVRLDDAELCLGILCIPLGGDFLNSLVGLMEGLIADLLPTILNPILQENLQKIVIGGNVTQPDIGTNFDMLLNIETLGTGTVTGEAYDMIVSLESVADVLGRDTTVSSSLGPVFFDDPIDPSEIFNTFGGGNTNLTVAVNSNLINQTLNAVYSVGASHFTLYNDKTYYGAQPMIPVDPDSSVDADGIYSGTLAKEGDTRIRLWPNMPPSLTFVEVAGSQGAAEAAIAYESATASQDVLRKNASDELEWQPNIQLEVDFRLAVTIDEQDGVFTIGAAGPPELNINGMTNNTIFQVPAAVLQMVLDAALYMGGDILADQNLELDLGELAAGTINGTEVVFLSDKDDYQQDPGECLQLDEDGNIIVPDAAEQPAGEDGSYDAICETIEFVINTNVVGVTGEKGSNLFFQMEARDPNIPPAPAIPQFDLDDDGVIDIKDNCKVANDVLTAGIEAAGGLAANIDEDGNPIGDFEDDLKEKINNILSNGGDTTQSATYGGDPAQVDVDWYNVMRNGDAPISNPSWLQHYYANANQGNLDKDRIGDLCEDDPDRDGVVTDYKDDELLSDNCPQLYNPGQEDSSGLGVGDACNVRETFVLIRSLGSRYTDTGDPDNVTSADYWCLSHSNYKASVETLGGASVSTDMANNGAGATIAICDPSDVNQRWYINQYDAANNYYQFFADVGRDNTNSWQLGAYDNNGNGHLKMVRFNDSSTTRVGSGSNRVNGPWKLSQDPSIVDGTIEDKTHPWILQPTSQLDSNRKDCLFYNTDGWGPDFDTNECTVSFDAGATERLPAKYYRWGIYIQGEQLWFGEW